MEKQVTWAAAAFLLVLPIVHLGQKAYWIGWGRPDRLPWQTYVHGPWSLLFGPALFWLALYGFAAAAVVYAWRR